MQNHEFSWNDFELTTENQKIYSLLRKCVEIRKKYIKASLQNQNEFVFEDIQKIEDFAMTENGVYHLKCRNEYFIPTPTIDEFIRDSEYVIYVSNHRPTKSLCFRRLEHLKHNFAMFKNLSAEREKFEQKTYSKVDFYKVVKVDTHVHHSACMNSKHLLNFIKNKLKHNLDDFVHEINGEILTLSDIFKRFNIESKNLLIDTLDTHAQRDIFQRFDRFNNKYNPYGQPVLRDIFLKYDNFKNGIYLAEITKQVINYIEESKYNYAEYRISIYGRNKDEWNVLSRWIITNTIKSKHVCWLIQIPRLYSALFANKTINNFEEMIQNIFEPLFEVTRDRNSNPMLAKFLNKVVGFDCVDDESLKEKKPPMKNISPREWKFREEPPYWYYMYYLYANISALNYYRKSKGLNVFSFRPHAGETGDYEHLIFPFITAQSISHGVQLRKCLPLQYLYYICKIGISMSPLSNNSLFLPIEKNPFPMYFKIGMNVSLSTDDPLQFHFTREPLLEEYSITTQIWKFTSVDQCEIARNSVKQSNFPLKTKKEWIGEYSDSNGCEVNDIEKTNVSNIRITFRNHMWLNEFNLIYQKETDNDRSNKQNFDNFSSKTHENN